MEEQCGPDGLEAMGRWLCFGVQKKLKKTLTPIVQFD
jgi:hypothetical protein